MVSWREFQHVPVGLFGLTDVFVDKVLPTLNFKTFTLLGAVSETPQGESFAISDGLNPNELSITSQLLPFFVRFSHVTCSD